LLSGSTFRHVIQDLQVPPAFQNAQLERSDAIIRKCHVPSTEPILRLNLILLRQLVNFEKLRTVKEPSSICFGLQEKSQ